MKTIYRNKFRYNQDKALLEYGYINGDGELEVLDATGLSRDNWDEDPNYWLDLYEMAIEDELLGLMAEL